MGQDSGFPVRDRGCSHHRPSRSGNRLQFQLFLPSGDRSGGDAVAEFQPRDQLPIPARHSGPTHEEGLVERILQRSG